MSLTPCGGADMVTELVVPCKQLSIEAFKHYFSLPPLPFFFDFPLSIQPVFAFSYLLSESVTLCGITH